MKTLSKLITVLSISFFIGIAYAFDLEPKVPPIGKLIGPPSLIEKNGEYYSIFDYGGLKFKHMVVRLPVPRTQCDAITDHGKEIMVVGSNPKGYEFYVEKEPIAYQTDHSVLWHTRISKTMCRGACE